MIAAVSVCQNSPTGRTNPAQAAGACWIPPCSSQGCLCCCPCPLLGNPICQAQSAALWEFIQSALRLAGLPFSYCQTVGVLQDSLPVRYLWTGRNHKERVILEFTYKLASSTFHIFCGVVTTPVVQHSVMSTPLCRVAVNWD